MFGVSLYFQFWFLFQNSEEGLTHILTPPPPVPVFLIKISVHKQAKKLRFSKYSYIYAKLLKLI
jgi:hypothetical protein